MMRKRSMSRASSAAPATTSQQLFHLPVLSSTQVSSGAAMKPPKPEAVSVMAMARARRLVNHCVTVVCTGTTVPKPTPTPAMMPKVKRNTHWFFTK